MFVFCFMTGQTGSAPNSQRMGQGITTLQTTESRLDNFGFDMQVATQQGKYLAKVLKDNPMVLRPGPNGPAVTGAHRCLVWLCMHFTSQQSKHQLGSTTICWQHWYVLMSRF